MKKKIRKALLVLAIFVPSYLALVALWSWVSLEDALKNMPSVAVAPLSARQTDILLRVEDPTFYQHAGLSLAQGQGWATLTSALAREMYLSDRQLGGVKGGFQSFYRGVFNCCKKIDLGRDVMALVVNANLTKDRQLALYSATVYMGSHQKQQIRGLAQAAETYLGKPLDQTSETEFIALVAMIKAPNTYHPIMHGAAHAERAARIAALLAGRCQPGGWFDTAFEACAQ